MPPSSSASTRTRPVSDSDEALLDRPIWSALTTSHKHLAEGGPLALRYPVDMTPFADMVDMSTTSFEALGDLMSPSQVAALFTPEPVDVPSGFKVVITETGEQMIGSPADSPLRDAEIVTLGKADVPAKTALTPLTKHGPFAARTAMQRYVEQEISPCVSWAVLRGREVVDQQCVGFADREAKTALRPDHIFRAYSNTKIFVTCSIMLLVEQGH